MAPTLPSFFLLHSDSKSTGLLASPAGIQQFVLGFEVGRLWYDSVCGGGGGDSAVAVPDRYGISCRPGEAHRAGG